jgi:GNAT superfamily N-acetyltransferase
MPSVHVRQLDPAAAAFEADLRRWHAAYVASITHGRADASPYRLAEVRDMVGTPSGHRWCGAWLAVRGDAVVAAGWVDLPTADNLHLAQVEVQVVPAFRRQGIGTEVAQVLEAFVRDRGRTVAIAEVQYPLEAPEDGAGTPGILFAQGLGYEVALGDVQRRLALPVDEALLDELEAAACPAAAGYRIELVRGPVPDGLVAGYAALASQLYVEAPAGDLDLEAEDPSVAGWRDREAALERQGITLWHAVALAGDEVVAHSTIGVSTFDRELCHQWGTLVRADHRGHRLGLALKVANHRALQADRAPAREIVTWNAAVNAHMIAVNEQLGFRPVGRLGEVQKKL